jgi:hypothetical protein
MLHIHPWNPHEKAIQARAEQLDISAIPSKADELHRLFDAAQEAILALLVFAKKVGVELEDPQLVSVALNSLLRNADGKRGVSVMWHGGPVVVDVDQIDTLNASRLALAEQYGVSEQVMLRYEQRIAGGGGPNANVFCNHRGCNMHKSIYFKDPTEMIAAEWRAGSEIWYCRHHCKAAFEEGALSDELLPVLQRIRVKPGLSKSESGAKSEDLSFLEEVGLISVEKLMHGSRLLCYQISLTDAGQKALDRLSAGSGRVTAA